MPLSEVRTTVREGKRSCESAISAVDIGCLCKRGWKNEKKKLVAGWERKGGEEVLVEL